MTRKQRNRTEAAQRRYSNLSNGERAEMVARVAFLSRKGSMPAGTCWSSVAPPRNVEATVRVRLLSRREKFRLNQLGLETEMTVRETTAPHLHY